MNIFHKRPLALILCITVGGFAFSAYGNVLSKILLIAFSTLLFIFSYSKILSAKRKVLRCCAVAIFVVATFSLVYFGVYFRAENKFDNAVNINATVEEAEPINSYTMKIVLKSNEIDGRKLRYKFLAYLPIDETYNLSSGDIINATAKITGFTEKTTERNNFSNGISSRLEDISAIEVVGAEKLHLPTVLSNIRERISRYIAMMSDTKSGGLLTALLIGDREKLSPQTRLDFKRIGISHILALSGMHLAIMSLGIGKSLSAFGVRKKARLFITCVFIFLYMALTGFSPSVLRSGIMIIIFSALFLLSKSKDPFTSLCCSVFIILAATPYSVFDIALWLSALATFGIIVLSEYFGTRRRTIKLSQKILRWLTVGILSSVFAIGATFMISVSTFGGISLLGVFSTLIFSILIEIIMYLGCIMIAIGWIIPIGKIIVPLCEFTLWLAEKLSSLDFIFVRGDNVLSLFLIAVFTAIFFGFAVLNIRQKKKYLAVVLSLFVICHITPLIQTAISKNSEILTYHSAESSDNFLLTSQGETCFISSAKYSQSRAYSALDILDNADVTILDNYYITHYSRQIEDELEVLLGNIKTDKIYILSPQNEEEEGILKKLERFLDDYSTEMVVLDIYEDFKVGEYRITPLYSAPYGEETSMNAFSISTYTKTICYISSGLLESSKKAEMYNFIKCCDQLILGRHGKKYKNKIYLDEQYEKLTCMIINSSNIFLTQENMEKYNKNGCEVISHPSLVELLK